MDTILGRPRRAGGATARPLQVIVLGLLALLAWVLRPVIAPLAVGGLLVLVGYPAFDQLVIRLGGRRRVASWVATLVVLLLLVIPVGLLGYLVVREAGAGIDWIAQMMQRVGGPDGLNHLLPRAARRWVPALAQRTSDELAHLATAAAAAAPELISSIGVFLAQTFFALVTVYYLFLQGPAFVRFIRSISPLSMGQTEALLAEFRDVARGLFWGNIVTAGVQGIVAGTGYFIFGVPKAVFLGALTALASFVPAIGTAFLWAPIVITLAATGHFARAFGLLGWSFVLIVGVVDYVLRPLVSKGQMKLPDLLVFLTLFGGVVVFGLKGLLLGPLVGSLAVTGLRLLARERPIEAP